MQLNPLSLYHRRKIGDSNSVRATCPPNVAQQLYHAEGRLQRGTGRNLRPIWLKEGKFPLSATYSLCKL